MLSCNQCGYEWKPRPASAGSPSCCPKCKRYDWDEPSKKIAVKSSGGGDAVPQSRSAAVGTLPDSVPAYEEDDEIQMCQYKEYDPESGETYRCGLVAHSPKVKHTRGERV